MAKIVTGKAPMSETARRFLSDKNRSRMFIEVITAEDGRSEFEIDGWKLKCISSIHIINGGNYKKKNKPCRSRVCLNGYYQFLIFADNIITEEFSTNLKNLDFIRV